MHSVSLLDLRNRVRVQTDTENAQRPTNSQLNEMLNGSIRSLYAGLADGGSSLTLKRSGATLTALGTTILMTTEAWQLRDVVAVMNSKLRKLEPFGDLERSDILNEGASDGPWFYRLAGVVGTTQIIELIPAPNASVTIEYGFIPTPPILVADADALPCLPGWDAWVTYDTTMQVLGAEETDVSMWLMMRDRVWQAEIIPATKSRDSHRNRKVSRVRR